MTALNDKTMTRFERWGYREFTLASGKVAYQGGLCAIKLGTGTVVPATGASDELVIGRFAQSKDATSAALPVNVNLGTEIEVNWLANGSSITANHIGALAFAIDDQTASLNPKSTGSSPLGRIFAVDSSLGVAVQITRRSAAEFGVLMEGAALSYTSNDCAIADYPVSGTVYDVPTTGAASTISLPANAREGTELTFVADGTKNGHTVTYRDVTTAISAALAASKRHQARAVFLNGGWTILTTVSP